MKRAVAVLLLAVMVFSLCACHKHVWEEATCTTPKTCTDCGKTEGEALGHDDGAWTTTKEATLLEEGSEDLACTRCGEVLDTRATDVKKPSYEGGVFNFTREEFIEFFDDQLNSNVTISDTEQIDPLGGHAYTVYVDGKLNAMVSCVENDAGALTKIIFWGEGKEPLYLAMLGFADLLGHDPSDVYEQLFDSLKENNECTLDGFKMVFEGMEDGMISLTITGE